MPVGLIGAGKHGERYLRHLVEDDVGLRVKVVCRRDVDGGPVQARFAGARFVADFREAATAPDIEAVVVAVPPSLHVAICAAAAGAGKAILVEKPLAVGIDEAQAIRDVVERAGVPLMVAHTLRLNHVVRALARELDAIGPLRQLSLSQRFEPSELHWLDEPAISGGGIVLHTGIHSFDLIRFFTARNPTGALATVGNVVTKRTEDNFAAVFTFDGEPLIAAACGSRSTASRTGTIELAGDRGQLWGDHHHGLAWRIRGAERTVIDCGPPVPTVRDALSAFAKGLTTGEPFPATLADGYWSVAMAAACYRSAASGRREPVIGLPFSAAKRQ